MDSEIKLPSDAEILRDWLQSLPYRDYRVVRDKMIAKCMVTKGKFANWQHGTCRMPALAKQAVNVVSLEYNGTTVFDLSRELAGSGVFGERDAAGKTL